MRTTKTLTENAKREIRKKLAELAGRMLRPNQRVRKPRGEKPTYPKVQ